MEDSDRNIRSKRANKMDPVYMLDEMDRLKAENEVWREVWKESKKSIHPFLLNRIKKSFPLLTKQKLIEGTGEVYDEKVKKIPLTNTPRPPVFIERPANQYDNIKPDYEAEGFMDKRDFRNELDIPDARYPWHRDQLHHKWTVDRIFVDEMLDTIDKMSGTISKQDEMIQNYRDRVIKLVEQRDRTERVYDEMESLKADKEYLDELNNQFLGEIERLKQKVQEWKDTESDTMEHWKAEREKSKRLKKERDELKAELEVLTSERDYYRVALGKYKEMWDEVRGDIESYSEEEWVGQNKGWLDDIEEKYGIRKKDDGKVGGYGGTHDPDRCKSYSINFDRRCERDADHSGIHRWKDLEWND